MEDIHPEFRITKQRRRVAEKMSQLKEIADMEELWLYLREEQHVSLASVYTCLKLLVRSGLVKEIKLENSKRTGYQWIG